MNHHYLCAILDPPQQRDDSYKAILQDDTGNTSDFGTFSNEERAMEQIVLENIQNQLKPDSNMSRKKHSTQ